jgi:hypothetical protein
VRAQHGRGAGSDRGLVVGEPRPIRGADLDQPGPGLRNDVGDPEAAADLDQLPARDHDVALALDQRGDRQQHGGRAIVDHDRGLCPGQLPQQPGDVVVARPTSTCGDVELEVGVTARGVRDGLYCGLRERGPTKVGVDDDAGRVQHRPQRGLQPPSRTFYQVRLVRRPGEQRGAPVGQLGARHRGGQPVHGG